MDYSESSTKLGGFVGRFQASWQWFGSVTRTAYPFIILIAALATSSGISGCDRSRSTSKNSTVENVNKKGAAVSVTGGSWIVGSIGDASTLLPVLATDSASQDIVGLVYCRLLKYGPNYEIIGDVASTYDVLDHGLRIRFHLRPNATWHDGRPLTADDIIFTHKLALDKNTPTPYRSSFEVIKQVKKIDKHTVDFIYDKPYAPALNDIVGSAGAVLPKHLLEGKDVITSPLNRRPVGCGPYRFVRWEAKREIELRAYDNYYAGRTNIDNYLYRIIPDQATLFLELQNFGVDEMGLRPQQYKMQTSSARFTKSFNKYRYTGFGYTYLGYNLKNSLFQDRRVRRALSSAIDKQEIIAGVIFGLGTVATGPYRPGMWYYKKSTAEPAYDPDAAKALLAQAGWKDTDGDGIVDKDGKPFKFEIVTNQGNLQRKQVAEIVQARLKVVGVQVSVRIIEWAAFLEEFIYKRKFDAVILGWGTGIDPDQYDIWHSSKTGAKEFNFVGYANQRVDQLLIEGRHTVDQEARKRIYQEVQDLLSWDQPYTFLYIQDSLPAIHNRVQGVKLAESGIGYNFEKWYIPKSAQGFHIKQ